MATTNPTLAQLLTGATPEEVYAIVLAVFQANGFPTTNWQEFGTDATRALAIATAISDLSANYIPTITAGGFTTLAAGIDNSNIRTLADQLYNLVFNAASFTVGDLLLTADSSAGTYNIQPGQLTAVFAVSGNSYINVTGGVLSPSSTLTLEWVAQFAGSAYNDPNASDISLLTPLPGVTISNPATDYTEVAHVGAGTGTVVPSGTPVGPHQVTIRIDSSGAAGVAAWSYSLDGSPFVSAGAVASASDLEGTGIDVTLVDGVVGTSFVVDDEYLFNTPGSWITTQGADAESNQALGARCRNRWSSLSDVQTESYYELLATSTPDVGAQVTQVIVLPDEDINNKVNVVVAGPEGALPPATVALIQAFITPRAIGTDYPTVQSPSVHDTTIAFTLTCQASLAQATLAAVQTVVRNYINEGGINPTIRLAKITELAMDQDGAVDMADVTIDGVAANLTLGSGTTFVVADLVALNITLVTQA